jgi:hypothetical protein
MSLSSNAVSHKVPVGQSERTHAGFVFPLILVCVALALILISAVFSPVNLETAGTENFPVGP